MSSTDSSITEAYQQLFAGERLRIRVSSKREFEALRVAFHKQHQTPRFLLELTDDSICASYDSSAGIGEFWLGTPRRRKRVISFEIVGADSSAPLEQPCEDTKISGIN